MNGESVGTNTPSANRVWYPILLGVLTLAVALSGTWISYLQFQANELEQERNRLEHERKQPSVSVYVETWEMSKHAEATDVVALVRALEELEEEHWRYSGRSILDPTAELKQRVVEGDDMVEPAEVRGLLTGIRQEVEGLRTGRVDNVPELMGEIDSLVESWGRRREVSHEMVDELLEIEGRYSEYTGPFVLSLANDLNDSLAGRADDVDEPVVSVEQAMTRLQQVSVAVRVSAPLREERPFDEPGFDALLAGVDGLMTTFVEGKESRRWSFEAVVENQSELGTVVRREARVELFYADMQLQMNVEAASDMNLGPYSVGSMLFVSDDLDARQVAFLPDGSGEANGDELASGGQSEAKAPGCRIAVSDLREKSWLGECRPPDQGVPTEDVLSALLNEGPVQ